MSIRKYIGATIIALFLLTGSSNAIPFFVVGEYNVNYDHWSPLVGKMDIQKPVINDNGVGGNKYFFFKITSYIIYLEGKEMKGSGYINSIYYHYNGVNDFTCTFDEFVLNGDFNKSFLSFTTDFYNVNGKVYNKKGYPKDFYKLPFLIRARNIEPFRNLFIFRKVARVPELPTSAMLTLGMIVFASVVSFRKLKHS